MSKLKKQILNHERNQFISFDEDSHTYTYYPSGDKRKTKEAIEFYGVTGWMAEFLEPFDADKAANATIKNPNSEWYGWDVKDVKEAWNEKRDAGSILGKALEDNINDGLIDEDFEPHIDKMWELLEAEGIIPIVSEWVIYDEDKKRASAIDIVGDKDGKAVVIDIKKFDDGMKFSAYGNKTFNYPLDALFASKFNKVSLQTSIYNGIVKRKYPEIPLAEERYVLLYSNEEVVLLPCLQLEDEVEKLYEF